DSHREPMAEAPTTDDRARRTPAYATPQLSEPEAVHAWSEEREHRWQEREAIEDGDRDDERARVAHRSEERALVEEHPRESDRDGEPGERDRPARGRHGARDRVVDREAARELLAEAIDDEQRVVDRDAEAD